MDETSVRILSSHLHVDEMKPVSYLPLKTITNVLGMSLDSYVQMAREKGLYSVAFGESESCINSGAAYVYHQQCLEALLSRHRKLLQANGWPSDTEGFIRRIAGDWLNEDDPVLSVVRQAFGDAQRCDK